MNFGYDDPIIHKRRTGQSDDQYVQINENLIIDNNAKVVLTELPSPYHKVQVTGLNQQWFEVDKRELSSSEFKVDYKNKIVTFSDEHIGKQLGFLYMGTGLTYVPTSMVYTRRRGTDIVETLKQLTDTTEEVREATRQTNEEVKANEEVRKSNENERIENDELRQIQHEKNMELIGDVQYIEPFDAATKYKKNNIVSMNGASYIAKQETQGNPPTEHGENEYWGLLARKGQDGTGTVHMYKDAFIAEEGQRRFNLSRSYDMFQNRTFVLIDGVLQRTPEDYIETSSNSIMINEELPAGAKVEIRYFGQAVPLHTDLETEVRSYTDAIKTLQTDKVDRHGDVMTGGLKFGNIELRWNPDLQTLDFNVVE